MDKIIGTPCLLFMAIVPALGQGPDPDPVELIKKLVHETNASDSRVRKASVQGIGRYANRLRAAVLALGGRLKSDPDPEVRLEAAKALGQIGPTAREAVPSLAEALKDSEVALRRESALALGLIGCGAGAAVSALAGALRDEDAVVRRRAAVALGEIGPIAKGAVLRLVKALADRDPGNLPTEQSVLVESIIALGNIGPDAREAIPKLLRILEAGDSFTRSRAIEAVAKIGRGDKQLVPLLVKCLKDKGTCVGAALAFGYIGPVAVEAVPELVKALRVEGIENGQAAQQLQLHALWSLEQMGPAAKAAIPALQKIASGTDPILSFHAKQALGAIKGEK
jgi:HEAT repeat protein